MLRRIVSLTLLWSALALILTGLVLYIAPEGRVDRWIQWRLLGLSKKEYQQLHTTFMVLFIALTLLHVYYNWRTMMNYLKNRARTLVVMTPAMVVSLVLAALFTVGTLYSWPPFKQIVDLGVAAKAYWSKNGGEPPFGHAESLPLGQLARREGLDPAEAQARLEAKGFQFEKGMSLEEIAAKNGVNPQEIFAVIRAQE